MGPLLHAYKLFDRGWVAPMILVSALVPLGLIGYLNWVGVWPRGSKVLGTGLDKSGLNTLTQTLYFTFLYNKCHSIHSMSSIFFTTIFLVSNFVCTT